MLGFGPQIKLSQTSLRSQIISQLPGETLHYLAFTIPAVKAAHSGQLCWQGCASHRAIPVSTLGELWDKRAEHPWQPQPPAASRCVPSLKRLKKKRWSFSFQLCGGGQILRRDMEFHLFSLWVSYSVGRSCHSGAALKHSKAQSTVKTRTG